MAVVGIDLESDQLVLHTGRDFKWAFDNVDSDGAPTAFPDGDLFLELHTRGQQNAEQTVTLTGADDGTYTLSIGGHATADLDFDQQHPQVQTAVEGLTSVGAGNVTVVGSYIPQWQVIVTLGGAFATAIANPSVVNLINLALKDVFDAIDDITGTIIVSQAEYIPPVLTYTATFAGSLNDVSYLSFILDNVVTALEAAIHAIPAIGVPNLVSVDQIYTPTRILNLKFGGTKTNTFIPKIVADATDLTGHDPAIDVEVIAPGKGEFTLWHFDIDGATAETKVESEEVALIQPRVRWQLVFLPAGEPAGGDPIARGIVKIQE